MHGQVPIEACSGLGPLTLNSIAVWCDNCHNRGKEEGKGRRQWQLKRSVRARGENKEEDTQSEFTK